MYSQLKTVVLNACACVSESELIELVVKKGSFKSTDVREFIDRIIFPTRSQAEFKQKKIILICDNAIVHQSNIVRMFAETKGVLVLYLSPYSPELNFCE